jgi:serine/threonine-protein kinase
MDDRTGERLGRYEILTELGRGAMGVVYKARDPKINRTVAVKTVSLVGQAPEEESEYRERFFREAEAAGRLSHPGIVTIFDVGQEPETRTPYIVMEFVGGESLAKRLSRDDQKLPLDTALRLTVELAEALDSAHAQGVVHRDLKPANILITEDGHAKIVDFGVAKLNLANHTLAGYALGTPAFMSPEQLNGDAVDGRSDLFSLGVILYTALTGHRPFQGNSALTVSFKVVNREPLPATVLNSELPPGLDSIVARAMAKDPAERYQSGREMVLDIEDLRKGLEPRSTRKQPGSLTGVGTTQAESERARSSFLAQMGVAGEAPSGTRRLTLRHGAARNPSEGLRKKAFASVLLVGVIVFGLRAGRSIWPHAAPPRSPARAIPAEPPASVVKSAPVKEAVTPRAKALRQPARAPAARPRIVKTARASAPRVTPAIVSPATVSPVAVAPAPVSPALLEIEVDNKFAEAQLSIWVDDGLAFTHLLEGTTKKHLVLFHQVQGHELLHTMEVSPGKHHLKVRVISDGAPFDQSAPVTGDFASGQENVLRITFDKHGAMTLSLQ